MAVTTVANLVVELSASANRLQNDLSKAEGDLKSFAANSGKALAGIGVAVSAAVIAGGALISKMVFDTAKELDDLSDSASALGIATKELQRLQFQAGQAGSSVEGVGQSLMFMQNAIDDAVEGNEQLVKTFARLGVDAKTLKGLRPEEQFRRIAAAVSQIRDQGQASNIARDIFGRGGLQQLNLLRSNLQETSDLFDKLGLGVSQNQEKNVDAFDKSTKALGAIWTDFKQKIAADAVPAFTVISDAITKTISDMGGLSTVARDVAIGIVGAIEGIAGAFNVVGDGIKFIQKGLLTTQIAALEVKRLWDSLSSDNRNAIPQAEIDRRNNRKSPIPGLEFDKFTGKSTEQVAAEAAAAEKRIEDLKTTLIGLNTETKTPVMDALTSIRAALEGVNESAKNAAKSIGAVGAAGTGGGFGTITDEATGRTMSIGAPPGGTGSTLSPGTTGTAGTAAIWNESGQVATINLNITPNSKFFDVQAQLAKDAVAKTLNVTSTIDPASNARR